MPEPTARPSFSPLSLADVFNADRSEVDERLKPPQDDALFGHKVVRHIPFVFGKPSGPNIVVLNNEPVTVRVRSTAAYLVFVHCVEDAPTVYLPGLADSQHEGRALGGRVSSYTFQFDDGTSATIPITRRVEIQQRRVGWGSSAAAAVPAGEDVIYRPGDTINSTPAGHFELSQRHESALDASLRRLWPTLAETVWMFALPNPTPDRIIDSVILAAESEVSSAVYAITIASGAEHPLRPGSRRRVRVPAPPDAVNTPDGDIARFTCDSGVVVSADVSSVYDDAAWHSDEPLVTPGRSQSSVVVDYVGGPGTRLFRVADQETTELRPGLDGVEVLPTRLRPVRVELVDAASGSPSPARLHIHDEFGEYLAPRGHQRRVNTRVHEDTSAEFATDDGHQYSYVDGACIVDVPQGRIFLEACRGFDTANTRTSATVDADTDRLTLSLPERLPWRERGWVAADTHVHFLSPQTALLEGRAEGVHVVNVLAIQLGELFASVGDFDGRTTVGAQEFGGTGEFLVRVGSENRTQVLGHISLLGYRGELIQPLSAGGPSESRPGDGLEHLMADWAAQCRAQGGLVVMPHAPDPQLERAADLMLGLVDAVELQVQNPLAARWQQWMDARVDPYGVADWYRYLSLGLQVPLVGGSDKMSAGHLLGGMRTYAQLGEAEFTYENWLAAIRAGNTQATVGPLLELAVGGVAPGRQVKLKRTPATLDVEWRVESVTAPVTRVEIVAGGVVVEDVAVTNGRSAQGCASVTVDGPTWLALRARGGYRGRTDDIAAHTSAVQIAVDGRTPFVESRAVEVLEQIAATVSYVDTVAPGDRERLAVARATLLGAYHGLHERLHRAGIDHMHRHG